MSSQLWHASYSGRYQSVRDLSVFSAPSSRHTPIYKGKQYRQTMLIQGYDAVQNPAPGSMLATGPVLLRGLLISYRIPGTRSYSLKLAIRTLIIICPSQFTTPRSRPSPWPRWSTSVSSYSPPGNWTWHLMWQRWVQSFRRWPIDFLVGYW